MRECHGHEGRADRAIKRSVVHDIMLTGEELDGLMGDLLVSREVPRGTTRFTEWLAEAGRALGRNYLPEVSRHFRTVAT